MGWGNGVSGGGKKEHSENLEEKLKKRKVWLEKKVETRGDKRACQEEKRKEALYKTWEHKCLKKIILICN